MGLFHHVPVYMGDLHLVHPALNLSILNAGILIMVQQVSLIMFSLTMVDFPMSFLLLSSWNFFCWTSTGDHSKMFLLFEYCCGTPPSCLKVMGGGLEQFSVSPRPLGFGFGTKGFGAKGLGPGLDNKDVR